jgi:hypothetical protein
LKSKTSKKQWLAELSFLIAFCWFLSDLLLTLKMEVICSAFSELHNVKTQKITLFIVTTIRTGNPTEIDSYPFLL